MLLLTVEEITKHFGPEPVLSKVSFEIRAGERIGLIGPNGTGKSTLLKILTGQEDADSGDVQLHGAARMAYLEQHPDFGTDETLWEVAMSSMSELVALNQEAEAAAHALSEEKDEQEHERLANRYDRLQQELHQRDAYHLDYKIEQVLQGLGFTSAQYKQPVKELSGGQQNRLLLAKILLTGADLLLLDEPSNHLDIEATQWLEEYLTACNQALLIVSHDRYLLDRVTSRTLELFHATVDDYTGNFSAYWKQKQERLKVQRRTYEKQQEFIAKTEDFIRKNKHGQKHAQAEDRRKKLERVEEVELPRDIVAPVMGFPEPTRTGDIVMRVEHLSKSYDMRLFQDLSFDIERSQRWGILGPNGTGKSTLLKCLLGEVEADQGTVSLGTGVKCAYYDQQLKIVDDQKEAVEAVRPPHKEFNDQQRRDLLARFGITGDMVFQKVESLSGGERSRVAFAKLAAEDANVYILDEPTNHLDLWAMDALERTLNEYEGTLIFVSHDRYFLNKVADHLLVVEPDRFRVIEGNYETYLHFIDQGLAKEATKANAAKDAKEKESSNNSKNKKNNQANKRKRQFPYRKVADLENDILECETAIEELQASLGTPEVFQSGERIKEVKATLDKQQEKLQQLYAHWEEASELN